MTSFGSWLRPTILGPLMTLWILTTMGSVMVGMATISGDRIDTWAIGMLWATFFGSTLAVILIAADVFLLKAKVRRLPTGAAAWISSVLAPFAVFFIWTLPFLPPPESAAGVVVFILAPMLAASLVVRFVFGNRPT